MSYFSVDVETSGFVPGRHTLLSIGIVELASGAEFYAVLENRDAVIHNAFDDYVDTVALPPVKWDPSTREWFKGQEAAFDCLFGIHDAYLDCPIARSSSKDVAQRLADWVMSFPAPRTFVAWPVSFDKPWIDILFHDTGVENPFDYRSVDIKSWICGRFGGGPEVERDDLPEAAQVLYIEADFPHHALSDARAQADTMRRLLAMQPEQP